MRRRLWALAVLCLVVAGVVLRVVVLTGRWGTVDSDEAVVGLMARDILDGEWRAFYWGQHYAGSIEPVLVALGGASTAALKLVPVLLAALSSVLTWRVGRRLLPDRTAQAAALLTWVGPGTYVWWSTKERGFYWASMVLGLLLVLAAQRIVEREGRAADWAMLGLATGLGFWTSPTVAYFAVPAGLWILLRRRPPLRRLWVAVPTALLGALPWLWHNLEQGWASVEQPPQPEQVGYLTGIWRLLWHVWPMALNLRWPIDGRWIVVPALAAVAYVGFWLLVALRRPPSLVAYALVAFPFVYAIFPGAWFVGEGRYGLFSLPFLALALAAALRWPPLLLGLGAVAVVLSGFSLEHIGGESPEDVHADIATLEAEGVDTFWADYWLGYRMAFLSGSDLVATSYLSSRDDDIRARVEDDPTPAFVFAPDDYRWVGLREQVDVPTRRFRTEHFVVVVAEGRIDPDTLPFGLVP